MFRSQTMTLHQIMFAPESMWDTMNYLAHNENVMFTHNYGPNYKPTNSLVLYANKKIKRCEELFHLLGNIEAKIKEFDLPLYEFKKSAGEYVKEIDDYCFRNSIEGPKLFEESESITKNKANLLQNQLDNFDQMLEKRLRTIENQMAFKEIDELVPYELAFATDSYVGGNGNHPENEVSSRFTKLDKRFNSILGILPTENALKLQKLIFRVAKENVVIRSKNLDEVTDPLVNAKSKQKNKTLMFILFPKGEHDIVYQRISSVLPSFDFVTLEIPSSANRTEMALNLQNELEDNRNILLKTKAEINTILDSFSQPKFLPKISYLYFLRLVLKREENFARHLIFLEEKEGFYQLQIWLPKDYSDTLNKELDQMRLSDSNFTKPKIVEMSQRDMNRMPMLSKPPTAFKLNEFTAPFQNIVDTYGVPRYQEINPAIFTIITFPFMFGLMFGDVGHGSLLLCFALYAVFWVKDRFSILYEIKWLLLLMGIFSVYCGLIYNEFFSVPLILSSSCYEKEGDKITRKPDCVYPFGTDWMWAQSSNETSFTNSFKMKFSIIIGVVQMLLGIILKGLNGFYFSSYVDLFFEAIPQFLFMSVTFGYMSFCIIVKWLQDWTGKESISIIQIFIGLFSVDQPLYADAATQQLIQRIFIVTALVCFLLMLIPKPLILHFRSKNPRRNSAHRLPDDEFDQQHKLIGSVK